MSVGLLFAVWFACGLLGTLLAALSGGYYDKRLIVSDVLWICGMALMMAAVAAAFALVAKVAAGV